MATKTSLKEFEPFFGGDQKGAFLVQAMFNGTNYTDRVGLKSGLLTELMRAENYKNYQNVRSSVNQQAQNPEDVPQDITDLLITTAWFHQTIDKSSTAGTNIGTALARVASAFASYLGMSLGSGQRLMIGDPQARPTTGPASTVNALVTYPSPNDNVGDYYLHILADRALWDLFAGKTTPGTITTTITNSTNRRGGIISGVPVTTTTPGTTGVPVNQLFGGVDFQGRTTDAFLSSIVDCTNNVNNLCFNSVIATKPDANLPAQATATAALTALQTASGITGLTGTLQTAIQGAIIVSLKKLIVAMKEDMMFKYQQVVQDGRANNIVGQFNVATVKNFMDVQTLNIYQQALIENIKNDVEKAIKDTLNRSVTIPHTTLNDTTGTVKPAKVFFDAVYAAWNTMHPDIRAFYTQNVAIFAKSTSRGLYDPNNDMYRQQNLTMDWIRLTDNEVDSLFKAGRSAFSTAELQNLRVNLMKDPLTGYKDVLFGANLPDINAGSNVWYTQSNGGIAHVQQPPVSFLRDLYAVAYATNPATPTLTVVSGTNTYSLTNLEVNVPKRPLGQFNLNLGKFTAAAIKREDDMMDRQAQSVSAPVSADLDYPFLTAYDMVYGQLWTFDSQKGQYFRLDDSNRKVYYDDAAKGDAKTCYATYLAKGSDANCLRVIQCIADGNSKSLNRCLDVIGDGNLWEIAADDAQKVGPDMIKLVLRKFGVKGSEETDSNGNKFKVPMSFEEWKNKIVANFSDDVKNTILNNPKLLNYLKGLIGVCRSNPNILNKNNPSIIARDNTPEYVKNLNMRKYKIPSVSRKTQYEFFAESLRNATQPHVVTQDMFNPITSGSFSNLMFVNPLTTMVPSMLGGNFYAAINPSLPTRGTGYDAMEKQSQILKSGSASMFSSLLGTIRNAFADTGLQLHQDDQAKLTAVVKKMETYENQLARMCSVLINIVKIARFYGIGLDNIDKDHPRVMKLSELNSVDDIREFVRGYAKELTKNMVTNMTIQQAASYELMNRVGPRLLDDCTGKAPAQSAADVARSYVDI